jgi:hypothetical protein
MQPFYYLTLLRKWLSETLARLQFAGPIQALRVLGADTGSPQLTFCQYN